MTSGEVRDDWRDLAAQLFQRRQQLLDAVSEAMARSEENHYQNLAGRVHDPGDEAVADWLAEVNLVVVDRHIGEIRAIEASLARLAAGTYGVCTDCGDAIARQRLEAQPTALRCYACQSRYEREHRGHRTSSL